MVLSPDWTRCQALARMSLSARVRKPSREIMRGITELEAQTISPGSSVAEVFLVFLRLGPISFGGPVAHLGYFRDQCVARRKWLDERAYLQNWPAGSFAWLLTPMGCQWD